MVDSDVPRSNWSYVAFFFALLNAMAHYNSSQGAASSSAASHSTTTSSTTAKPQSAQPQATTSSSGPAPSAASSRSAQRLPSNPYSLSPTYTPVLDEPLPFELVNIVVEYGVAGFFLLELLLEHGTEVVDGVRYILGPGNVQVPFHVQRRETHDNGMPTTIPYILGGQYMDLYNSIHRRYRMRRTELPGIRRQLRDRVEVAIAGRSIVHDWHLCLPANDARVAENPKHAAFLATLIRLRNVV